MKVESGKCKPSFFSFSGLMSKITKKINTLFELVSIIKIFEKIFLKIAFFLFVLKKLLHFKFIIISIFFGYNSQKIKIFMTYQIKLLIYIIF